MKNRISRIAIATFAALAGAPVHAQGGPASAGTPGLASERVGDVQLFAGVRLWANEWDIPFLDRRAIVDRSTGGLLWVDEVRTTPSDMELVPMPTLGVRYGNVLGSMTYFVPTSYNGEGGLSRSVERSELDVNVGYFVTPSVLVSVGYKHAKVDRISDDLDSGSEIDALLLGVTASAPLTDRLSLYANLAYGIARNESEAEDARREDEYDAYYTIGEFGISTRLTEGAPNAFLKSVSASFGYRVQNYTIEDIGLGTHRSAFDFDPISARTRDLRTSTNGFVVAIVASF